MLGGMTTPLKRAGVVAAAVVAAEIVFLLVHLAAGVTIAVPGQGDIGALAVGITAAVAGLLAWALLAILERATRRGRTVWLVIASVVLLVSLAGPLGAATAGAVVALAALHLTVGLVLIVGLSR
jgi:hypothetical protein